MKYKFAFILLLINVAVTCFICVLFQCNGSAKDYITPTNALTIWASVITIVFVVFSFIGIYNIDAKVRELNDLRDKQDAKFKEIEKSSKDLIDSIDKVKSEIVHNSEDEIKKIIKKSFERQSFFDFITRIAMEPMPYKKIAYYTKILKDTQNIDVFDAGFIYISRGQSYMQMGKFEKAKNDFETAIKECTDINKASAYNALGSYYVLTGKFEDSISCFEKALEYEKDSPMILVDIGNSYSALRQYDEASKYYDKALTSDPDFAQAYYNIAKSQIDKHDELDNIQTLAYLKKCVSIDPSFIPAYINIAGLLKEQGQIDEAIDVYDNVIGKAFGEDLLQVILQRGIAKRLQGKHIEAIYDFNFVFTFRPTNLQNITNLAISSYFTKHIEEANYFAHLGLTEASKQNNHICDGELSQVLNDSAKVLEALYSISQQTDSR